MHYRQAVLIALLTCVATAQGQVVKQKLFNVDSDDGVPAEPSSESYSNQNSYSVASSAVASGVLHSWSYYGRFQVKDIPETAKITKLEFRVWAIHRKGSDPACDYYARWYNWPGGTWSPTTETEDGDPSDAFIHFDITDYPLISDREEDEGWHVITASGTDIPITRDGYVVLHIWDDEPRPYVGSTPHACIGQSMRFISGGHVSQTNSQGVGPQLIVTYTETEGATPVYTVVD